VYTMVPPKYHTADRKKQIRDAGQSFTNAIKAAGIKKVVNLSSVGAHMPAGCGPVSGLYFVEQALNALENVDVKHLRPGFFYTNFLNLTGMVKNAGIWGNSYGAEAPLVLVHPVDIAIAAAEELLSLNFTGKSLRYIADDIRNSNEVAAALGKAIGKPELPYVEFNDEEALHSMLAAGMEENTALNYVEMGQAVRYGEMMKLYFETPVKEGVVKLDDFAREFAEVYARVN